MTGSGANRGYKRDMPLSNRYIIRHTRLPTGRAINYVLGMALHKASKRRRMMPKQEECNACDLAHGKHPFPNTSSLLATLIAALELATWMRQQLSLWAIVSPYKVLGTFVKFYKVDKHKHGKYDEVQASQALGHRS